MEITIQLDSPHKQLELFGSADAYLRIVRQSLDVKITARNRKLIISGEEQDIQKAYLVAGKEQDQMLELKEVKERQWEHLEKKH